MRPALALMLILSSQAHAVHVCGPTVRHRPVVVSVGDSTAGAFDGTSSWSDVWAEGTSDGDGYSFATSGSQAGEMSTQWTNNVAGHAFSAIAINSGTNNCFAVFGTNTATADAAAVTIRSAYQAVVDLAVGEGYDTIVIALIPPAKNAAGWDVNVQRCIDRFNDVEVLAITGETCTVNTTAALDVDGDDDIDVAYDSGDGKHPNQAGKSAWGARASTDCGALTL